MTRISFNNTLKHFEDLGYSYGWSKKDYAEFNRRNPFNISVEQLAEVVANVRCPNHDA